MNRKCAPWMAAVIMASGLLLAPGALSGADLGIGAAAWYAWWDPYWSQVSDTRVLPRIRIGSEFSGGPLLNVSFNETWGLSASYAYGRYEGRATSFLLNPLYYYIEQPVATQREARRHDAGLLISGRPHSRIKLYGGVAYSGYLMSTRASVAVLSYSLRVFHHLAGPVIGVECSIPIVPDLFLYPGVSGVFQFSRFKDESGDRAGAFLNSRFGGTDTTLLYAGLDLALSLAYTIRRIGVTLAIGGRFRCLWITDIEKKGFVADGRHDMLGGINLTAMYTFSLTAPAADREGEREPLQQSR